MNVVKLLTWSICLTLIFHHCSKKDPASPEDKDDQQPALVTKLIDSAGGSLSSENLTLLIPQGAFSGEHELSLHTITDEQPFTGDAVSSLFRIDGIPTSFSKPLRMSLKYQSPLSGQPYIAIGEDAFVSSLGALMTGYRFFEAVDSSGFLICNLPVPDEEEQSMGGFAKPEGSQQSTSSLRAQGLLGSQPIVTGDGNFKISASGSSVSLAAAQTLGTYLEQAYTTFQALGFKYDARKKWPVSVTIRSLDDEVFGYNSSSILGNNHGYMEFNSKKINQADDMRLTAGHEFFHFVQALYDPRNRYSKAKLQSDHYWLDEATAVWSEEKFTNQQNYISPIRQGNEMAPFNGMQKGADGNAKNHGYGMSAIVKYLVGKYGEDKIVRMYQSISAEAKPVDAVSANTESPALWLENFYRNYILGTIYNLQTSFWVGNAENQWEIKTEEDTLKTFTGSYPDLSAKLYKIRLSYPGIDSSASIDLTATGGDNEITAFKYNSSGVEYLNSAKQQLTIPDVRILTDEGWHLFVLVTNTQGTSPYTGSSDIKLDVRVTTAPEYKHCYFYVRLYARLKKEFPAYPDSVFYYHDNVIFTDWAIGKFTGNTFNGDWDYTMDDGYYGKGNVAVTLNRDRNKIDTFNFSGVWGFPRESFFYITVTQTCNGFNIPYTSDYVFFTFSVEGPAVVNYLGTVESSRVTDYFTEKLVSYEGNDLSEIEIEFDTDDLQFSAKRANLMKSRLKSQLR
ncbi:hypothetical protein JXJ21_22760 [candidate division KSB1 bacterium]|nr:hypothetical protein [candidate division KSB1 bacterium]